MRLTQKQELYVSRYMRSVADALAGRLNERQCERVLTRLQTRILEQIDATGKVPPEDIDVLDVMRKLGTPETQADLLVRVWTGDTGTTPGQSASPSPSPSPSSGAPTKTAFAEETRPPQVWLGVLAWLAVRADMPVWAVRILVALVGAVLLPIALLVYMGAYFYLRSNGEIYPAPLHPWRMISRPVMTALMLGVIHFAGVYAIKAVYFAHDAWLKRAVPEMAEWAWFESEAGRMLFWMMVLLLPLALFSAMPLANAWDYSLKRLNQACVALYAIVVSFGVASFATGIILAFVREFTGR